MMKHIIQTSLLLLFSLTMAVAQNQRDVYQVQVDGLGCPFCAYGLEKKFKEFKGIKKITIDIDSGDFRFEYPADNPLTADQVVSQVEKAGYTPKTWTITRADGTVESSDHLAQVADKGNFKTYNMAVRGVCGMCKARIEKTALSVDGVGTAEWSIEENVLVLGLDSARTSKDKVGAAILAVGHDVEGKKATDKAYDALPPCCLYRTKSKH